MAQMIPELNNDSINQIQSNAEKAIYRSLRDSLGKDVLVVHSLELVAHPPNKAPVDAEADFVVFDLHRGFIVIEVKGGGISFDATERCWRSRDGKWIQHEIKDPFRQAKNSKHEILRHIKISKGWGKAGMPRVTIGHAVIFPDLLDVCKFVAPDRPIEIIGVVMLSMTLLLG